MHRRHGIEMVETLVAECWAWGQDGHRAPLDRLAVDVRVTR